MEIDEPIKCTAKECPAVLMPTRGLPPTPPAEARRWLLVSATDGLGENVGQMAFCPEHRDLAGLTSVGAHTRHHARWDSKLAPKYQVVILKADGTPIPTDEPVMIFRGRDPLAVPTIRTYRQLAVGIMDARELEQIRARVAEFEAYDDKRLPGPPAG